MSSDCHKHDSDHELAAFGGSAYPSSEWAGLQVFEGLQFVPYSQLGEWPTSQLDVAEIAVDPYWTFM